MMASSATPTDVDHSQNKASASEELTAPSVSSTTDSTEPDTKAAGKDASTKRKMPSALEVQQRFLKFEAKHPGVFLSSVNYGKAMLQYAKIKASLGEAKSPKLASIVAEAEAANAARRYGAELLAMNKNKDRLSPPGESFELGSPLKKRRLSPENERDVVEEKDSPGTCKSKPTPQIIVEDFDAKDAIEYQSEDEVMTDSDDALTTQTLTPELPIRSAGPSFSSTTGKRKAPPTKLDFSIPGATATATNWKKPNEPTHYLAIPCDASPQHPMVPSTAALEKIYNDGQLKGQLGSPIKLAPVAIPSLTREDIRKMEGCPFQLKEIPNPNGYKLSTPATARFNQELHDQRRQLTGCDKTGPETTLLPTTRVERLHSAINIGNGNISHVHLSIIDKISLVDVIRDELGKHLAPRDILNLYSVSVNFHNMVNAHLRSTIYGWAKFMAPESFQVFDWNYPFYSHLTFHIPDPAGAIISPTSSNFVPGQPDVQSVPTIKWLAMLVLREDITRDILAALARQGLRCPKGTSVSLKKMWLLMDCPETKQRKELIGRRDVFSDVDLYNIQLFLVKLTMRFNDPNYGPESNKLVQLFMGQKGLYPLWQMMFGLKYRSVLELFQVKLRYDYGDSWSLPAGLRLPAKVCGVPRNEIGRGHMEGWGRVDQHLERPDELIHHENARRQLHLEDHQLQMFMWGYVDIETGANLFPSEEEIYIEDEAFKTRAMDSSLDFTRSHCLKANWYQLNDEQRRKLFWEQEDREDRLNDWKSHVQTPTLRREDFLRQPFSRIFREHLSWAKAKKRNNGTEPLAPGSEIAKVGQIFADGHQSDAKQKSTVDDSSFCNGPPGPPLQFSKALVSEYGFGKKMRQVYSRNFGPIPAAGSTPQPLFDPSRVGHISFTETNVGPVPHSAGIFGQVPMYGAFMPYAESNVGPVPFTADNSGRFPSPTAPVNGYRAFKFPPDHNYHAMQDYVYHRFPVKLNTIPEDHQDEDTEDEEPGSDSNSDEEDEANEVEDVDDISAWSDEEYETELADYQDSLNAAEGDDDAESDTGSDTTIRELPRVS